MIKEKFFPTNAALFTVISACLIVAIFMGLRMVFGLFTDFFVEDLQCTVTQFGLATVSYTHLTLPTILRV